MLSSWGKFMFRISVRSIFGITNICAIELKFIHFIQCALPNLTNNFHCLEFKQTKVINFKILKNRIFR